MTDRLISIGVLTPHGAVGPEEEFARMAPGRITTRVARIPTNGTIAVGAGGSPPTSPPGLRALMKPALLDDAADLLTMDTVDVIGYASTSSAYAVGFDEETAMISRLSRRLGLPVVATCASAVLALRVLNVDRMALIHPPWFNQEINELGTSYFQGQGFHVVMSAAANLSRDPHRIEPAAVIEWTAGRIPDDADAVFIGGNGFRAAGAIEAVEVAIGRPVLESNQVLLWNLLTRAGATLKIRGYGTLFTHEPSPDVT